MESKIEESPRMESNGHVHDFSLTRLPRRIWAVAVRPRIDPLQLLKCLGVLLTPQGGIRSREEVQRLASLMMKFSKKLVSKCVYILILKNTDVELLGMFMSAGGWTLVLTWLSDGIYGKNWALVIELLELLLMCPVDVERLKSNSIPRLVKGLSKDEGLGRVNYLATKLVDQWLKIVKDETVAPDKEVGQSVMVVKPSEIVVEVPAEEPPSTELAEEVTVNTKVEAVVPNQLVVMPQQFYKLTVRDGKQIIAKVGSLSITDSTEPTPDPQPAADAEQPAACSSPTSASTTSTLVCARLTAPTTTATATGVVSTAVTTPAVTTTVTTTTNTTATIFASPSAPVSDKKEKDKDKERDRDKDKEKEKKDEERKVSKERSKYDKTRHKSTTSTSTSKDKSSNRDKSSINCSGSSNSSSNSSTSAKSKNREKERAKERHRDRGKHRSNGSLKQPTSIGNTTTTTTTTTNITKDSKEKQAEKDKDTLAKIQPKSVDKFGRIPKKPSMSTNDSTKTVDKAEKKESATAAPVERAKPSISIEVRKKDGSERPKTVKVFNSKLRSTGLEEAARPPPPRPVIKKVPPALVAPKRSSPAREPIPVPEKRPKMLDAELEKPGGIKLIPPKPKPQMLQESDMFMDALAASATNKKELRKRKRRISKDSSALSPPSSPTSSTPAMPPLSPTLSLKSITAPKFYKDTLEPDEPKADEPDKTEQEEVIKEPLVTTPASTDATPESPPNVVKEVNGLRGVLVYHKRRKVKKTVMWRSDSELEEIQYFELDENERVNVTKTFMDMKQMEHVGEREALQLSRKLPNEDLMDERTNWRALIPIDLPPPLAEPGKKSTEKDIQFAREKVILQALYFNRSMLPESPGEPDPEHHPITDPVPIPLDDLTGNPDSVNDFQSTPWPEPKGSPIHQPVLPPGPPTMFSGIPPFNPQMGPPGFGQPFNNPGFMPPHMLNHGGGPGPGPGPSGDWRMQDPSGNMQSDMGHPPMNQGPNMFGNRPENFMNIMDDGSGGNKDMGGRGPVGAAGSGVFPPPGFGPGPMQGPPGHPPGHGPIFPNYSGNQRGCNRGGFRNMGRGGWFRPGGPPPGWHRGGGNTHWGGRGGGVCHQFKMHGFCRQRDTCPYMHPQPNQGQY